MNHEQSVTRSKYPVSSVVSGGFVSVIATFLGICLNRELIHSTKSKTLRLPETEWILNTHREKEIEMLGV